jgi:hypothetical protein
MEGYWGLYVESKVPSKELYIGRKIETTYQNTWLKI